MKKERREEDSWYDADTIRACVCVCELTVAVFASDIEKMGCVRNCATYLSFYLTCVCLYGHLDGTGLCSNEKKNSGEKSELTYPISLQVNYCWCLIVLSYIEGKDICKQDDLSAVAPSFLFLLSLSLLFDWDRWWSSLSFSFSHHHQREISCSIEDQFSSSSRFSLYILSGVAGLLLSVYMRIIVQALTCKLPMAYCTCNSFSRRKKKDR